METVPFSDRQSRPPTETGEMVASLSLPRSNLMESEPKQQNHRTTFEGDDSMLPALGAPVLRTMVANRQNSIDNMLSSERLSSGSCVSGDDLTPPLVIGLKPRTINEAQNIMPRPENLQQSNVRTHERALGSAATSSAHSMVDREVLVMREAMELSTASTPTPLGRQRRRSLFQRAHSISIPSNEGSGYSDTPHAKSDRSNSSAMVKGRNINSIGLDETSSDHDHHSELGRDKYNTVLRDWLMHVVEKDDQQNAEVRNEGHFRLDPAMISATMKGCKQLLSRFQLNFSGHTTLPSRSTKPGRGRPRKGIHHHDPISAHTFIVKRTQCTDRRQHQLLDR